MGATDLRKEYERATGKCAVEDIFDVDCFTDEYVEWLENMVFVTARANTELLLALR